MSTNPSKDKGNRGEALVRDALKAATGLKWERTPLSGALDAKHGLKSDIYIPNEKNIYSVEVKFYEDSHISHSLITSKSPTMISWWEQTLSSAATTDKKPLLVFKHNRSKLFVAFTDMPAADYNYIYINRPPHEFYISLLDDWLEYNKPKFI